MNERNEWLTNGAANEYANVPIFTMDSRLRSKLNLNGEQAHVWKRQRYHILETNLFTVHLSASCHQKDEWNGILTTYSFFHIQNWRWWGCICSHFQQAMRKLVSIYRASDSFVLFWCLPMHRKWNSIISVQEQNSNGKFSP